MRRPTMFKKNKRPRGQDMIISITLALLAMTACTKAPSPQELRSSIEIVDMETKWVAKAYQPWPPKLILVPSISFRVKNISSRPINYLNFNAIFKFKEETENLGDAFLAAIRKEPIMPGQLSEVIMMKSNYGVEGKTLESFKDNPYWKPVVVKLFVQSKGSIHVPLGEWAVSKVIDFKEPEPVGMGESKKKID